MAKRINFKNIKGNVIISNNQTGGTISNNSNPDKALLKLDLVLLILDGIVAITIILTWFGFNPSVDKNIEVSKDQIVISNKIDKPVVVKSLKQKKYKKGKSIIVENIKGDVVISHGQTGGITAHTVNVNPIVREEESKAPILNHKLHIQDSLENDLFVTQVILKIISPKKLPYLFVIFYCPTIKDARIKPMTTQIIYTCSSFDTIGKIQRCIQDAHNSYILEVKKTDRSPVLFNIIATDDTREHQWEYNITDMK